MLLDIFTADNKMLALLSILIALPALVFSLSLHEFAHGYAAYTQGDSYAKNTGRLTLNPFKHLDPIGTFAMLIIGFGWAKPVPVVPSNFRNGRKSHLIVAFAGVFANLVLATIAYFLMYFFQYIITAKVDWFFFTDAGYMTYEVIKMFLTCLVFLNINLAVFNLMPIPPLDGYNIFKELFIGKINYKFFANVERYATFILIAFLVVGNQIGIISGISNFILSIMERVMDLIFIAFK